MSWSLCQGNGVEPDEDQMGFTSWGSFYKDFGHIPSFPAHVFGEKRLSKAVFGITSNYLIVPKTGQYFLSPLFFRLREGEDVSLAFWLRCQPHRWGQDKNQKEEAGVPWEGLNQDRWVSLRVRIPRGRRAIRARRTSGIPVELPCWQPPSSSPVPAKGAMDMSESTTSGSGATAVH